VVIMNPMGLAWRLLKAPLADAPLQPGQARVDDRFKLPGLADFVNVTPGQAFASSDRQARGLAIPMRGLKQMMEKHTGEGYGPHWALPGFEHVAGKGEGKGREYLKEMISELKEKHDMPIRIYAAMSHSLPFWDKMWGEGLVDSVHHSHDPMKWRPPELHFPGHPNYEKHKDVPKPYWYEYSTQNKGVWNNLPDVQTGEPMDIAMRLLKESAEGNWGFMNWPKKKPHEEYSSEALGNPSPPAGVTHLYPEGESEAWTILPNILPFFRDPQGRLDHRPDEELQTAVLSNVAHENTHEGLHSIGEIYGNAAQDEYPADISGYLVGIRNKYQQWKDGKLPNFGHRRLIEQFTEGMEPEEIAMNEALAQAKRQAQMGDKQNVSGFNVNHFDSDGNLVETGEPMDLSWRLLKDRKSPEAFRHKKEYDTKYESSPSRHKYRAELARERRKKGVMGHGGADMSHTRQHTIVPEDPHSNRARHFKERGTLKAEEPIERETLREVKALRRDVKKVIPPRHTPQKKDS